MSLLSLSTLLITLMAAAGSVLCLLGIVVPDCTAANLDATQAFYWYVVIYLIGKLGLNLSFALILILLPVVHVAHNIVTSLYTTFHYIKLETPSGPKFYSSSAQLSSSVKVWLSKYGRLHLQKGVGTS